MRSATAGCACGEMTPVIAKQATDAMRIARERTMLKMRLVGEGGVEFGQGLWSRFQYRAQFGTEFPALGSTGCSVIRAKVRHVVAVAGCRCFPREITVGP